MNTKEKELIKTAQALDRVSIHHIVEFTPVQARCFDTKLRAMLKKIDRVMPRMQFGDGNPNNGKTFHTYRIGKEYSRVVYVDAGKNFNPEANWEQVARVVKQIGKAANADEIGITNDDLMLSIRLWWD